MPTPSPAAEARFGLLHALGLLALTAASLAIHGYHPFAEDAEIYVPQIVKRLHPSFFPFGARFFETHARLTLFPNLLAALVRGSHLPLDAVLFACHLGSIFLLLLAAWRIASRCFSASSARWATVALTSALLTLPVAGTKLYILDQYLNPRSISAFAILFAIEAALASRYWLAAIWLIATALVHPLMAAFGILFVVLLAIVQRRDSLASALPALAAVPGIFPSHVSQAYWQCLNSHSYYHLLEWRWYEWLGIVAPLVIFWLFARVARRHRCAALYHLALATLLFAAICLLGGIILMVPARLVLLSIYQPTRGFQLVYTLMVLISGGLLGQAVLKNRAWRWLALFVPLCAGMYFAQRQLFPGNRHIEWPGARSTNPWVQAFAWIRSNTPSDAIFALDPDYMSLPGEDQQGFRAIAWRSSLCDATKDWSAVVMFPGLPLADQCLEQIGAATPWHPFAKPEFDVLSRRYGVSWIVLRTPRAPAPAPAEPQIACPYQRLGISVCCLSAQ